MPQHSFIFISRYGSGKSTQATLLIEKLKEKNPDHQPIYIQTGQEFRNFFAEPGYTQMLAKQIVERGDLMPIYMCVYLWGKLIVNTFTGKEPLVFDGTPRKKLEAETLEDLFPFYGLEKPWVIYLDVKHEESHRRLSIRARSSGRADDSPTAMEERRKAYETEIVPTIEYYRTDPNVRFLDIDGERSVEDIHADIVKRVGL